MAEVTYANIEEKTGLITNIFNMDESVYIDQYMLQIPHTYIVRIPDGAEVFFPGYYDASSQTFLPLEFERG